jgi:hypothetical protein
MEGIHLKHLGMATDRTKLEFLVFVIVTTCTESDVK